MSTCPDSDLYSAYVDGEVPSPWKEKLEAHLASCPVCTKKTERYNRLRMQIREDLRVLSDLELEASFSRLSAKLGTGRMEMTQNRKQDYLGWARKAVLIPVPLLAAMFLAAFFLPAYLVIKNNSRTQGNSVQYAAIRSGVSAANANISQTVKSLSTSTPVYSPDLLPYAKTENLLAANNQQLFAILSFASQFESAKDIFSDAQIIIIKLPALTQFSNTGEQLFKTNDDPLQKAAGFY